MVPFTRTTECSEWWLLDGKLKGICFYHKMLKEYQWIRHARVVCAYSRVCGGEQIKCWRQVGTCPRTMSCQGDAQGMHKVSWILWNWPLGWWFCLSGSWQRSVKNKETGCQVPCREKFWSNATNPSERCTWKWKWTRIEVREAYYLHPFWAYSSSMGGKDFPWCWRGAERSRCRRSFGSTGSIGPTEPGKRISDFGSQACSIQPRSVLLLENRQVSVLKWKRRQSRNIVPISLGVSTLCIARNLQALLMAR